MSFHVVIVPGILGSVLKRNGKRIYPSLSRLHELRFDPADADDDTVPERVFRRSLEDHYDTLARDLERKQVIDGVQAGPFHVWWCPYDWRRPVDEQSARLGDVIKGLDGNVAIVAHSMGGLVSKHWLLSGEPDQVRKVRYLFTVGTPWLGAPDALDFLADEAQLLWVAFPNLRHVTRTLPSVYQLVTSREYFRGNGEPYVQPSLSYSEVKELANCMSPDDARYFDQYNENLLQKWVYDPLPQNVHHCVIVGTGRKTSVAVSEIYEGVYRRVKAKQAGDGRVPHRSAMWPPARHTHRTVRYVDTGHGSLCSAKPVWQWIMYTLATNLPDDANIDNLLLDPIAPAGERVLVQCPVDVLVSGEEPLLAASFGEYLVNTLPDARVQRWGTDGTLVDLPLGLYSVQLRGTGDGTMTIRHLQETATGSTLTLFRAKVSPDMVGELYRQKSGDVVLELGTPNTPLHPIEPIIRLPFLPDESHLAERVFFDVEGPKITVRLENHILSPDKQQWIAADAEQSYIHLEAQDVGIVHSLEWSTDGKNWFPYTEPVPVRNDELQRWHVRATDAARNQSVATFAFGVAKQSPRYSHHLLGEPLGEAAYLGPVSIQFLPLGTQGVPAKSIRVVINGQDKHRHVPVGDKLELSEPGIYTLCYQIEDASGRFTEPVSVPPFMVTAAQEVAAATDRVQQAIEEGLPLAAFAEALHIRSVHIDGCVHDMNQPLPLIADRCEVLMEPTFGLQGLLQTQYRLQVPLRAHLKWLPPTLRGAQFSRKETVSVKFQVHGQKRLIRWLSRAVAVLVGPHGRETELPVEHVPELEAGLVLVPCADLPVGRYRVEIRSRQHLLDKQAFTVV